MIAQLLKLGVRPNKKKHHLIVLVFQKEEDEGLFIFNFFAKHLKSKWPQTFQLKMTDSFLFIAILQVS